MSKCNIILCSSSTPCIIAKGVVIKARQLSAITPSSCFSTVGSGIADGVIYKCFTIVGHKLIAVIVICVVDAGAIKKMQFRCRLGSDSVFITCNNVTIIIICPSAGLAKSYIVFACQSAKIIILISASRTTVFKYSDDITHRIVLVLNTLIKYAVRCKLTVAGLFRFKTKPQADAFLKGSEKTTQKIYKTLLTKGEGS